MQVDAEARDVQYEQLSERLTELQMELAQDRVISAAERLIDANFRNDMTHIMSRIENKLDGLGNRVTSLETRMYAHMSNQTTSSKSERP